ncbi:MAG: hypothetical protein J5544_01740 [Clostridia bacterium]|nr:hypothetical protein [Clostridia bacterium]
MKHFRSILLILLAVLTAAGCSPKQSDTPGITANAENTAGLDVNTSDEPAPREDDFDNRFGNQYDCVAETEDAVYFARMSGKYICYYDKDSGENGVLCAKPECEHDEKPGNTGCDGYVDLNGVSLNYYGGKLYFVKNSSRAESASGLSLMRMEPDGTGKELVFRIDLPDEKYAPQRFYMHRGKLYGCNYTMGVTDGAPSQSANVTSWDLETGEFSVVYEDTEFDGMPMVKLFFFDKYMYICTYGVQYPEGNINSPVQKLTVNRWDTEKDSMEELYHSGSEGFPGGMSEIWVESENEVYLTAVSPNDGCSRVYRLNRNEIEEMFAFDEPLILHFVEGGVASAGCRDGQFFLKIKDLSGNTVYDGTCPSDSFRRFGDDYAFGGIFGVFGSTDRLYIAFSLEYVNENDADMKVYKSKECLLTYDLSSGEPVETYLCGSNRQ